jgi:hypothetical protein
LELIREQNANWKHMAYAKELERIFNKIPLYLQKTRDTSKRMAMISSQVDSLKKRTERLKERQASPME